ncbi:type VII secretion integral membrane protein EccD [Micromonospora sp. Llam7]|nr:type VII secretion integral membrane protein EccD [Micromonospora tarapacensis]
MAASVLLPFAPLTATLLAGLRMGPLPTEPEHLQEDIDPEPAAGVLTRTRQADAYLTGLYGGIGAAAAVAVAVLAIGDGWAAPTLAGLVAVVSLLSVRSMTSAWHRLAAGVPGLVGPVAVFLAFLIGASVPVRVSAVAVGVVVAVPVLTALARLLPGRRSMPYWGRIGDILQVLAGVAQLPVLLTIAGAYGWARGLGG